MRSTWTMLAAAAAFAIASGTAEARVRRRPPPAPAVQTGTGFAAPSDRQRGPDIYSRRPGDGGIIRWNTPNAQGNLGSASTGGGGGGP